MRVVLDTNVLLAAMMGSGFCHELLHFLLESESVTVVLSEHILDEFRRHASRFRAPASDVDEAVRLLRRAAEIVEPAAVEAPDLKDRDDVPVLGTAAAAKADALVTGDKELLALGRFHDVPILSPRDLYERLR